MPENTKTKREVAKDKKFLTLFLLILPSLLLAMTGAIQESVIVRLSFQVVLLIFHMVIFKNLLDDFYGE